MSLASELIKVATREIGVEEIDGTNTGKRVNEYKAATNLNPTESWPCCAAFICWCVREALRITGIRETATFKSPTTAGALDLENWSRRQDNSTWTKAPPNGDIKAGDIITFKFKNGGHTGIATSSPDSSGYISTVEGNTDVAGSREGGGVFAKKRHISQVHGRIRFTI